MNRKVLNVAYFLDYENIGKALSIVEINKVKEYIVKRSNNKRETIEEI